MLYGYCYGVVIVPYICCSSVHYTKASQTFTVQGTPYFTGINYTLCSSAGLSGRLTKPTCGDVRMKSEINLHMSHVQVTIVYNV